MECIKRALWHTCQLALSADSIERILAHLSFISASTSVGMMYMHDKGDAVGYVYAKEIQYDVVGQLAMVAQSPSS